MTMSGKVVVKFLKPIHENEVKGETFILFQGSAAARSKIARNDIDCSESSCGMQYDHVEQSCAGGAGEGTERRAGVSGCKSLEYVQGAEMVSGSGMGPGREKNLGTGQRVSPAVMRERMAKLVRYRMLQVCGCVSECRY